MRQGAWQPSPAEDGASSAAGGSRRDLGTFTPGSTASRGMGAGTCRLQGVMSYPWPRSPVSFERNRPTFVFQGKMSRGSAAPRGMGVWTCRLQGVMPYPWPRSPVSFEPIGQPSFFRGKLRQGAWQPSPAEDGGSSAAGGSGRDLAHLLRAALLPGGWGHGPAVFTGCYPHHGRGPL